MATGEFRDSMLDPGWFRKHNLGGLSAGGAQFGCGVIGHTTWPHKLFVSKFV